MPESEAPAVLVTGATGQIGQALVKRLLTAESRVDRRTPSATRLLGVRERVDPLDLVESGEVGVGREKATARFRTDSPLGFPGKNTSHIKSREIFFPSME